MQTHFYNRPSRFRLRIYDPLVRLLIRRLGWYRRDGDTLRILAARGRRTGRWYYHPVGVCMWQNQRHLVAFYGDSQWARNLRAGAEAQLQVKADAEPIRALELSGDDKAAFMTYLVERYPLIARIWLKVKPTRLTAPDLERLVDCYPVFRVEGA